MVRFLILEQQNWSFVRNNCANRTYICSNWICNTFSWRYFVIITFATRTISQSLSKILAITVLSYIHLYYGGINENIIRSVSLSSFVVTSTILVILYDEYRKRIINCFLGKSFISPKKDN